MPSPTTLGPFPYFPLEIDKDGNVVDQTQLSAVLDAVKAPPANGGLTDLFVISHGWNNDMPEAEALYAAIFGKIAEVLQRGDPTCVSVRGRRAAVAGVLWPSKKFDDASLIPGGAADVGDASSSLGSTLDLLAAFIDSDDATRSLATAKALVPKLATSLDARDEFVRIVRAFMPHDVNDEEPVVSDDLYTLNGDELLQRMSRPNLAPPTGGGAADLGGGAAGFTDWVGKAIDGARALANLVTYYQMKNRAGVVGENGVYDSLRQVRSLRPADGDNALKLHLIGHSFGCRVVTAATAGPANAPPLPVDSLILLQAAFSHFGFAQAYDGTHDGFFRRVVTDPTRVRGPLLITFTAKDLAVGLAYPIASRIARQIAAAIGDASDPYGGLGRNGAQKTPGATVVTLAGAGTPYTFTQRGIYNLDSNAVIGGHSDLIHDEVGWAIVNAVAAT